LFQGLVGAIFAILWCMFQLFGVFWADTGLHAYSVGIIFLLKSPQWYL